MRIAFGGLCLALLGVAACCTTGALPEAEPEEVAIASARGRGEFAQGEEQLAKVSSHLLEARRLAAAGKTVEEIQAAVPLVRLVDGLAQVEIRLEQLTPGILEALGAAGLEDRDHSLRYARATGGVQLDDLDEIAAVSEVATIHPQYRGRTRDDPS